MKEKKILIVEDERIIAEDIKMTLWNFGLSNAKIVTNGFQAVDYIKKEEVDLVLMDIVLEGKMSGIQAAKQIRELVDIPIIYLTSYSDKDTLEKAKLTTPLGYLIKPFEDRELYATIEMALHKYQTELALKRSERRFKELSNLLPQTVFEIDLYGIITYMNQHGKKFFNYPEEIIENEKINFFHLLDPNDRDLYKDTIKKLLSKQEIRNHHFRVKNHNGYVSTTLIYSSLITHNSVADGIRGIIIDITKEKKLEHQLLRSERLAGVGQLAAGIAHEIRNPLGNISTAAQLCTSKFQDNEELNQFLSIIQRNADIANRIIKELLDFANPREMQRQYKHIIELIERVVHLVELKLKKKKIIVETNINESISALFIDINWIEQAFLNLMLNAIDAIEEKGIIKIEVTENVENGMQEIKFSDTGEGIKESELFHIFDPFYTTKKDGVGLGLSLVHQIVQAHKGKIDIESTIGEGTTICIQFPLSMGE